MTSFLLFLAVALQLSTLANAQQGEDPLNPYNNPTIGATLEHYDVDRTENSISKFTCADGGARCVFRRDNFDHYSFGKGQETQVYGEGATWAAIVPGAVLTLGHCVASDFPEEARGSCVVSCNANCTCAVTLDENSDPTPCVEVKTRPPLPAPVATDPPLSSQCPKRQFANFCGELMNTGLPLGVENNYDCFNFCGGAWVSSCDLAGQCGTTTCDNKTATGTKHGEVLGCTLQDKISFATASNGSSGADGSSRSLRSTTLAIASVIVGFIVARMV